MKIPALSPTNLLVIMSDEHTPGAMGGAGHPDVLTPNLDALAKRGTRFVNASCASPICVPARAALATGRNVFETGYWDNVDAYDGVTPSWHHVLREAGHEVVSIGKLHYRGWEGEDYGFSESRLAMHIHGGRGEPKMLLRDPPASVGDGSNMLRSAKAGQSDYNDYDDKIEAEAIAWLRAKGQETAAKPWVLFVSLVAPHFPLTVPEKYFAMYRDQPLRLPKDYSFGIPPDAHPFAQEYARITGYNLHFKDDDDVRRALCGYYGLISYMDDKVGRLLAELENASLTANTRVAYLSDHGDNVGARGLWGKSTMYRESVGIPLILSGPGIDCGRVEKAAVSHIDLFPTVLDAVGIPPELSTASPRSASLLHPVPSDRFTLAEYHTIGSRSAVFMVQDSHFKYVHYCDHPPELFDLASDPEELVNVAQDPAYAEQLRHWDACLRQLLDPAEIDRRAKSRQQELITFYGGEEAIRNGQGIGGYTPSPIK